MSWPYETLQKRLTRWNVWANQTKSSDHMSETYVEGLRTIELLPCSSGEVSQEELSTSEKQWLIRFVKRGATYPNGDIMPAGLWDIAPPIGNDAWQEGHINVEGGKFSENAYTPTENDQYHIRQTFIHTENDPDSNLRTYLLSPHDPTFAAINKRVIK